MCRNGDRATVRIRITQRRDEAVSVGRQPSRREKRASATGRSLPSKAMNARILNVALRGATLGSRFALLFCLAKYLSPAEVGQYGLVFSTIGYALFVMGFDFYTYSTRELMGKLSAEWPAIIKNHFLFVGGAYVITIPAIGLIVLYSRIIPNDLIVWFFILLVLEHLAQELNRLLISMSRPLLANTILFVRSGGWVCACLPAMFWIPQTRNLDFVFGSWACGGGLAVGIGAVALRGSSGGGELSSVDWKWIRTGIGIAFPLLGGTLASRVLFTADRYFEQHVAGDDILGAYTFYVSVANAILAFLDASVISISGPKFVGAVRRKDLPEIENTFKEFRFSTCMVTGGLAICCALLIKPVVLLVGKQIYIDHLAMFYLLLLAAAIFCLSMIPHYRLYAYGADRAIVLVNVLSCIIFLASFFTLRGNFGPLSVPLALIVAFTFTYGGKHIASRDLSLEKTFG